MDKIKRLRFEKPFNGLGKALTLIPESYRTDNKIFEMTDGNEHYRIRWEGDVNEGQAVVLKASDKTLMNEDIVHMKHLMGFKAETTLGTPNAKERVSENNTFRDMMNLTSQLLEGEEKGDRKPITESAFAGFGFTSESEEVTEPKEVVESEVTESEECLVVSGLLIDVKPNMKKKFIKTISSDEFYKFCELNNKILADKNRPNDCWLSVTSTTIKDYCYFL
jgi:hypothetical protein